MNDKKEKPIRGGRNLIILGLSVTAIALLTTAASLQIYHNTGDVYLDRSRPGYISEDEKHDKNEDQKESFPSEGKIDSDALDEYLKELDAVVQRIDNASDAFSPEAISDETLGIIEDAEIED